MCGAKEDMKEGVDVPRGKTEMNAPGRMRMAFDVFTVEAGPITLAWPIDMSLADYDLFCSWICLMIEKIAGRSGGDPPGLLHLQNPIITERAVSDSGAKPTPSKPWEAVPDAEAKKKLDWIDPLSVHSRDAAHLELRIDWDCPIFDHAAPIGEEPKADVLIIALPAELGVTHNFLFVAVHSINKWCKEGWKKSQSSVHGSAGKRCSQGF